MLLLFMFLLFMPLFIRFMCLLFMILLIMSLMFMSFLFMLFLFMLLLLMLLLFMRLLFMLLLFMLILFIFLLVVLILWVQGVQCSGSVVVTANDSESGRPGSNPEWGLIYYETLITAQGLPKPSSLRGSTLGTRAAKHKGCNWACKLTDGCSLKSCARPHLLAYATEIKSTQLHAAPLWLG